MGTMNHDVVLVMVTHHKAAAALRGYIRKLPKQDRGLFAVRRGVVNGYVSVVMVPDGSKEGWDKSNHYNEVRAKFIEFAKGLKVYDIEAADIVHLSFGESGVKLRHNTSYGNGESAPIAAL